MSNVNYVALKDNHSPKFSYSPYALMECYFDVTVTQTEQGFEAKVEFKDNPILKTPVVFVWEYTSEWLKGDVKRDVLKRLFGKSNEFGIRVYKEL